MARRVHHIYSNNGSGKDMICTYFDHLGPGVVLDSDVNKAVKVAVADLKLPTNGIPIKRVGTHSLRAGGAMALALNGATRDMIKKIGRWSSDTFLMYIHEQIAHLTHGVAEKMSQVVLFFNVEGATTSS